MIFGDCGNISVGDVGSNDDIVGGDDGCDDDVVGDGGGAALGSSSLLVKSLHRNSHRPPLTRLRHTYIHRGLGRLF